MVGQAHEPWGIILPLAISFFTFQQISYLVDASKGKAPDYSWLEFAAYVVFFPQLIAGPIVRHNLGLFKKFALADELADFSDPVFASALGGNVLAHADAWIDALAYSLHWPARQIHERNHLRLIYINRKGRT